MTYTVLDLYSGAGGAAKGYHDAGFKVIGVDNKPMPRYPYEFICADALNLLDTLLLGGKVADVGTTLSYRLNDIDAIHASPPCQRWSMMSKCRPGLADKYPDLVTPTRELLQQTGLPYVIENVPGAPLRDPVTLCGSHFRLWAYWSGHGAYEVRRHREFESWPFKVSSPGPCDHRLPSLPVYGHGAPGNRPELRGAGFSDLARDAMQIDWMTRAEMDEAIPPVYARYVGIGLMGYLREAA